MCGSFRDTWQNDQFYRRQIAFTGNVLSFQLKEMCRRELDRLDTENKRNTVIIGDYKQVWIYENRIWVWIIKDNLGNYIFNWL